MFYFLVKMVEAGGVEPPSQLNLFKTSTCLFRAELSVPR